MANPLRIISLAIFLAIALLLLVTLRAVAGDAVQFYGNPTPIHIYDTFAEDNKKIENDYIHRAARDYEYLDNVETWRQTHSNPKAEALWRMELESTRPGRLRPPTGLNAPFWLYSKPPR